MNEPHESALPVHHDGSPITVEEPTADATPVGAASLVTDAPLVIDEVELERLERELADAAQTLEAVERICEASTGGADTALAIRQLLDDGRFVAAGAPTSEPHI